MKTLLVLTVCLSLLVFRKDISGTYTYLGGSLNGRYEPSSKAYSLQRIYQKGHFKAYLLESGEKPYNYQSGDYVLKGDSCLETETFNPQSAALTGKTIRYRYSVHRDTLVLKGILPNGKTAEEFWLKKK